MGSKIAKNYVLNSDWGIPSSSTSLRTCRTSKSGLGPLSKLNTLWSLAVQPVLKNRIHDTSYKKSQQDKIWPKRLTIERKTQNYI